MSRKTLRRLEQALIAQGYSRRYVRRLVLELADHCDQLESDDREFENASQEEAPLIERIGDISVLCNAVASYSELDPLPKKHPFACYVVGPLAATCVFIVFTLYLVFDWLPQDQHGWRKMAVDSWNALHVLMLAILPAAGSLIARKCGISFFYGYMLTLILSLSTLFSLNVATCEQSGSAFVHSNWNAGTWRLFVPAIGLIVGVLIALRLQPQRELPKSLHENATTVKPKSRLGVSQIVSCVVLAAFLIGGAAYWITSSLEDVRQHPVDNLVASFNSSNSRSMRFVEALQDSDFRAALLDETQQKQTSEILSSYNQSVKFVFGKNEGELSDPKQFRKVQEELARLALRAREKLSVLLTEKQQVAVAQKALKAEGWSALFDNELRKSLRMSGYQFCKLKDVYLDSIEENHSLAKRWINAATEDRPGVEQLIADSRQQRKAKFEAILSRDQLARLQEWLASQ